MHIGAGTLITTTTTTAIGTANHNQLSIKDERNIATALRVHTTNAVDNDYYYTRYSSPPSSFIVNYNSNRVHGSNVNTTSFRSVRSFDSILGSGGLSSGDISGILAIRAIDQTTDGVIRLQSVMSTFGVAVPQDTVNSESVMKCPIGRDAYQTTNSRGLSSRNSANNGNYSVIYASSADQIIVGDGTRQAQITPVVPTGATGSRPGSPATGQCFFDTTVHALIVWDGANWRNGAGTIV